MGEKKIALLWGYNKKSVTAFKVPGLPISPAAKRSGFDRGGSYRCDNRALGLCKQCSKQAAGSRERQPQSGDGSIAGDVNQVGAESGRETTECSCRQAVGE